MAKNQKKYYPDPLPAQLSVRLILSLIWGYLPWVVLAQNADVSANLQVDLIETQWLVQATCATNSNDSLDLSYRLRLERTFLNGLKDSRERTGDFSLVPGQPFYIGPFAIPNQDSSSIKLTLNIYQGDRLIASDFFPKRLEKEAPRQEEAPPELSVEPGMVTDPSLNIQSGVTLGGFVLQQTKTPWGQRFYELFAQQWQQAEVVTEYNIVIEEVPFRGINTIIKVTVDNEEIFSQVIQPKYDYLIELSNYAFQVAVQEIQRRNQVGEDILLESKDDIDIY